MKKLKICVYAICKNEEKFVDKWMDSMSEADLVVVTDTGSDDGTVERLRERGALVFEEKITPWRFDRARNVSLSHVPEDADVCVCTDLDELFEAGWRKNLEKTWLSFKPKYPGPVAKTGRYVYNWSLKPDGTPDVQFYYFKVHERKGFCWKCPVHEYVFYEGKLPLEIVYIDGMTLNHYPDTAKSRGSYLPLLLLAVAEEPQNERMRYYLGREYMYKGEWEKCVSVLTEYLGLPSATWNEERSAAMRWIAKCFFEMRQTAKAYVWYWKAAAEAPHLRDPLIEFSKICCGLKDWPTAYFLAKEALAIGKKSKTFVNMGYAWDHTPDDLCSFAAYNMNMPGEALFHAKKALAYSPDNERLKNNVIILEAASGTKNS